MIDLNNIYQSPIIRGIVMNVRAGTGVLTSRQTKCINISQMCNEKNFKYYSKPNSFRRVLSKKYIRLDK